MFDGFVGLAVKKNHRACLNGAKLNTPVPVSRFDFYKSGSGLGTTSA